MFLWKKVKELCIKCTKQKGGDASMINFDVLNAIYAYLYYESSSLNFKMKGFFDKIYLNRYAFPESFEDKKSKNQIENSGFSSAFEVLNAIYSKIDIDPLDLNLIASDASYDLIHLQFYTDTSLVDTRKKHTLHNFIIFFSCDEGSIETNGYRILYSKESYFTSYISSLLKAKYLSSDTEIEESSIRALETVLIGICQYLKIDLPDIVSNESLLYENATQQHFEEFLALITRNEVDRGIITKQAKKMFVQHRKNSDDKDILEDHYEFFENVNCWNSDWKFEPEDVSYFISEMIGRDFSFDYPNNTYSHDLFPYIQSALAKQNLELMSFDTQCDSYLFFVVYKNDILRIEELAKITEFPVSSL